MQLCLTGWLALIAMTERKRLSREHADDNGMRCLSLPRQGHLILEKRTLR